MQSSENLFEMHIADEETKRSSCCASSLILEKLHIKFCCKVCKKYLARSTEIELCVWKIYLSNFFDFVTHVSPSVFPFQ